MKAKPEKFRVYPENKTLYYTVFVWRTLSEFRKSNPGNSHALALCKSWLRITYRDKAKMTGDCGEIHFCRFHLRIGIITHEFCHAVISWAARRHCIPDFTSIKAGTFVEARKNSREERFCHALGNMVRQCVSQLYKRKIIK